jgi:hypothetical protein
MLRLVQCCVESERVLEAATSAPVTLHEHRRLSSAGAASSGEKRG